MKKYAGARTIDGVLFTVDGERLNERFGLKRYVNSWFEWGYPGDAPRQLALALPNASTICFMYGYADIDRFYI